MKSQDRAILFRAAFYSPLAGAAAGIFLAIAHFTGASMNGDTITGSLITGAISFVIALVFFSGFMLYFSRKYPGEKA